MRPGTAREIASRAPTVLSVVGVAAWALTAGLTAQQVTPSQQPVFRAGTELVQIDVVVVDKDGRTIHGLTKGDFEILEKGKRQDVVALNEYHFTTPPVGPMRLDIGGNTAERLVVLVLNDHRTLPVGGIPITGPPLVRMKDVARQFIRALAGRAQLALLRTSGEQGVELTDDAQALLDALDAPELWQKPLMSRTAMWEPLGEGNALRSPEMAGTPLTPALSPGRVAPGSPVAPIPYVDIGAIRKDSLIANDGRRKVFVLIGDTEINDIDAREAPGWMRKIEAGRISPQSILGRMPEKLERLFNTARDSNSAIYIVNPNSQGGRNGNDQVATSESATSQVRRAATGILAASSGGFAARSIDGLTGVSNIIDELDDYYVLGFAPPNPKDTGTRAIEVRVNREGVQVRHRSQYQLDDSGRVRAQKASSKDPLLGLAYSPVPTRDLPLRVWAAVLRPDDAPVTPHPPAAGRSKGPGKEAPGSKLALWLDAGAVTVGEYAVFVIDVLRHKEAVVPIGRILSGNVPTPLPLDSPTLAPGRYQIRIAARAGDIGGSVFLTVDVPDFAKTPLALTAVTLGLGDDYRTDFDPLPFTPTFDRAFDGSATLRVAFDVWRQGLSDDVATTVAIVDLKGASVRSAARAVSSDGSGRVELPLSLDGLASGSYTLRITATSGALKALHEIGISVR